MNQATHRWAYVYVDPEDVVGIGQQGYMSARLQYQTDRKRYKPIIIRKYEQQFFAMLQKHSYNFVSWQDAHGGPRSSLVKQILQYLDWRCEHTERGSRAIYFMLEPMPHIPGQVSPFKGRTMLRFPVKRDDIFVVSPPAGVTDDDVRYAPQHIVHKWSRDAIARRGGDDQLWLSDVVHGYIVPESGLIPPGQIEVASVEV